MQVSTNSTRATVGKSLARSGAAVRSATTHISDDFICGQHDMVCSLCFCSAPVDKNQGFAKDHLDWAAVGRRPEQLAPEFNHLTRHVVREDEHIGSLGELLIACAR